MKKFFKFILFSSVVIMSSFFTNKPIFISATEAIEKSECESSEYSASEYDASMIESNVKTDKLRYYDIENITNDKENQIIRIPMEQLPDDLTSSRFIAKNSLSANSVVQDAFEYHFKNYVKLAVNFVGDSNSKITLTFDTYSWSSSDNFSVKMYTLDGTLRASKNIWKSSGNPASVYFYLPEGDTYYFRFENSSYGESIDGVGYWTLE
ncbi:MAG: hypothetical protein ACERKN_00560 [Velocimicrobium sp.]